MFFLKEIRAWEKEIALWQSDEKCEKTLKQLKYKFKSFKEAREYYKEHHNITANGWKSLAKQVHYHGYL